jgi:hypothetical protein
MADNINGRTGDVRSLVSACLALTSIALFCGPAFGADEQKPTADAATAGPPTTIDATAPRPTPAVPAQKRTPLPASTRVSELNVQLQALRVELADLKTRYTELHPDVAAKRRQIVQVQDEIRGASKR